MANEQAIPAHGARLYFELDPVGAQGTFTEMAEVYDVTFPGITLDETETTPHRATIDEWIVSPVIKRGPVTFTVNNLPEDPTHDHLTGMIAMAADHKKRGCKVVGAGSTGPNNRVWLGSGFIKAFNQKTPGRSGAWTADCEFRFSGPMIINGVVFS